MTNNNRAVVRRVLFSLERPIDTAIMKYKVSTDEAIIKHIAEAKDGEAILHACVGNGVLHQAEGIVTACDTHKRIVTLQMLNGSKNTYSFDHISVPAAEG